MAFFINKFLPIFPVVLLWLAYFGSLLAYFKKEWLGKFLNFKVLLITILAFRVFYAGIVSIMQYYVWSGDEFTKALVNSPISSEVPLSDFFHKNLSFILDSRLGYFVFYAWGHFWVNVLLIITMSSVFYIFLKALKKYSDRFFNEGELELGFILALVVGWPNFIIFIPLVFIAVIFVSIFRGLYFREAYTTLGVPMLIATPTTMIFGSYLIKLLQLTVFRI